MTQALNPDKMDRCCFCGASPLQASARRHYHSSEQSHIQTLINRSIFAPLLLLVASVRGHFYRSCLLCLLIHSRQLNTFFFQLATSCKAGFWCVFSSDCIMSSPEDSRSGWKSPHQCPDRQHPEEKLGNIEHRFLLDYSDVRGELWHHLTFRQVGFHQSGNIRSFLFDLFHPGLNTQQQVGRLWTGHMMRWRHKLGLLLCAGVASAVVMLFPLSRCVRSFFCFCYLASGSKSMEHVLSTRSCLRKNKGRLIETNCMVIHFIAIFSFYSSPGSS